MTESINTAQRVFRLWIATYTDWQPEHWHQTPPRATALEAVDDLLYSMAEAALFIEGFNSALVVGETPIWAVAVPIAIRYEGDVAPGLPVVGHSFSPSAVSPSPGESPADDACIEMPMPLSPAGYASDPDGVQGPDHFQGFDQSPQRSR